MAKDGYVTKSDLKSEFKRFEKRFEKTIKSYIIESEVKIMGEIKNMREEFDVHQYSHARINDEIQDHEERIKNLETAKI